MAKSTFAILGILAVLLLSLGVVNAASSTEVLNGITMTTNETALTNVTAGEKYTFKVTINNQNGTAYNVSFGTSGWTWDKSGVNVSNGTTETFIGTLTIAATGTKSVIAKFNNISNSSQELFDMTEVVTLSYATTNNDTTLSTNTFCEQEGYNETGDLEISNFDVNNEGTGDDDAWQYLDAIEITVDIENTNRDDSVSDVEVMIVILDGKVENSGKDVTNDFDISDDVLTSIGRLRDRETETVTFKIDELPSDISDGTYYMYIMAYESGNEENQCASISGDFDDDHYFKFSVESVDYEDSITARPSDSEIQLNTYCGQENLQITFPVYNLGTDKEEKVLVNLYNKELGVNEYVIIDDLRNGKKEDVSFFLNIPSQLNKEKYDLYAIIYFDWDTDESDEDTTSYNEQTSDTSIRLTILDCKAAEPTVTANLESSTRIGQDVIIKATIKNNGKLNDFVITPTGFESWADLVSVTPQTISIASGNSEEVVITLSPTKAGTQSFNINTVVDGETYSQPVSLNIADKPSQFGFAGISSIMLYSIIGIIALLVIIFLILIVRIARRPTAQF